MGHEWKKILDRTISCVMAVTLSLCAVFPHAAFAATDSGQSGRASSSATTTQTMHRMYNPNSGEHFYTASSAERDALVQVGWNYEGDAWTAPTTSSSPVYRLYSGTDHHYTPDRGEKDALVGVGWSYEGIGWYSDDAKGVPLYRQFNPNVDPSAPTNNSGSHNYTISKAENDHLVSIGWQEEGIGWYGVKAPTGSTNAPSAPNQPSAPSDPATPSVPSVPEEPIEGVVHQDGVIEVSADHWSLGDDGSVVLEESEGQDVVPGSVMLLHPSEEFPEGAAVKVSSTTEDGNALKAEVTQAQFDDVVKSMRISGTTDDVRSFVPDVEVVQVSQEAVAFSVARGSRENISLDELSFKPMEGMTLTVAPSVEYEFDYDGGSLNSAKLTANVDASFSYENSLEMEDVEKKIFSTTFSTPVLGMYVDADFYLTLHASGEMNITADLSTNAGFEFDGNAINPVASNDLSYEAYVEAQLRAGFKPELCLGYFGIGIADIAPEVGVAVEGGLTQRPTGLICDDLSAWAYVDLYVGDRMVKVAEAEVPKTVLGWALRSLKVPTEYHPLTKENSPIWNVHAENGAWVPVCTWGYDHRAGESMKLGLTDNVNPLNTLAIFDYSLSEGGVILVTKVAGDAANPASVERRELIYRPVGSGNWAKRSLNLLDDDSKWSGSSVLPTLHGAYKKDYQDYYLEIEVLCGGFTVTSSSYPGDGQAYKEFGTCDEYRSIEEVLAAYGRA